MIYVAFMTFISNYVFCNYGIGCRCRSSYEQSKVTFTCFLTIIGGANFRWFTSMGMGNIHSKEIMVLYKLKEVTFYSLVEYVTEDGKEKFKRVSIDEFAVTMPTESSQHGRNNGLWFVKEASLPPYSVNEIYQGLAG